MSCESEYELGQPGFGDGDGEPVDPEGMVANLTSRELGGVIVDVNTLPDAELRAYAYDQGVSYEELLEILRGSA